MTISLATVKESFAGTGDLTAFAVTIQAWASSEYVLYSVNDSTGVATLLGEGVDYSIAMGTPLPAGCTVTPLVTRASGTTWVVYRETPDTQQLDYVSGGPFPAASHEEGLDRAAARSREHRWMRDRTLRIAPTDNDRDMVLPIEADRANMLAGYDASGQPTAVDAATLSPSSIIVGTPGQTLLPYTTTAQWLAYLSAVEDGGECAKADIGGEGSFGLASAFGKGVVFTTNTNRIFISDASAWSEIGVVQLLQPITPTVNGRLILDRDLLSIFRDNGAALEEIRPMPPGHLSGLSITYASSTTLTLGAGRARSDDDTGQGILAAASTKTLNTSLDWFGGPGGRMLTLAAPIAADTWFHVFAIFKPDGSTDFGMDTSDTAANLLNVAGVAYGQGYRTYRHVGWVLIDSAGTGMVAWVQVGDFFYHTTERSTRTYNPGALDYRQASGGQTLTFPYAPPSRVAKLAIAISAGAADYFDIEATTVTHGTPSNVRNNWYMATDTWLGELELDGSRQLHMRCATIASHTAHLSCDGWWDHRGKE